MGTFLFKDIIVGPIHSRRLGSSLGVNLLSTDNKLCNFECIYCECGWTTGRGGFNAKDEVIRLLEQKLKSLAVPPDVLTFAGNGEPTMHPDFAEIIDRTIELRDKYAPSARVAVLSNGTMAGRESVRAALGRVDQNILKLDSAFDETVRKIDQPKGDYSLSAVIERFKAFDGELIIQTMFLRGAGVDNTTEAEVSAWIDALRRIGPKEVMIYSLDRDTPAEGLEKVSKEELEAIAARVERETGIKTSAN